MRTVASISSTAGAISALGTFRLRRPKATLSNTDMWGNSAYCWNTVLTLRWYGGVFDTSSPSRRMRPVEGDSKPASMRSVVVLPQPEGPSIEKNSPRAMAKCASCTATKAPKRFVTCSN